MTRILVWSILIFSAAYDIVCALLGWPTISAVVRQIDNELGCLLRWTILALWCHWFVSWGWPK